jgi:protein-disulfide isomerase
MSRKRQRVKKEEIDSLNKGVEEKEQEREDYDAFSFLKNKKQTAAVAGMFFIVGFLLSWMVSPAMTGQVIGSGVTMSSDEIGQYTIDYINENLLREGFQANLLGVSESNGMHEVEVDVIQDGQDAGQQVKFYVSGNGELLFFNEPVDMTEPIEVPDETTPPPEQTPPDAGVPKSDRPVADVFIMSYCPFGLQMQKAVIPVMELLGDKADINIRFVHYIMHDKKEIDENTNQYCIQKNEPEKLVDYLKCFVPSDDHEGCAVEAGIDQAMLDECVADTDQEFDITGLYEDKSTWSNGRFPPYMVDAVDAEAYGVRGSPTFVLNGQTVSVNRSPEAVKQAICDAFNEAPEECSTALSATAEAPGIGPLGSGTASASGSAVCG